MFKLFPKADPKDAPKNGGPPEEKPADKKDDAEGDNAGRLFEAMQIGVDIVISIAMVMMPVVIVVGGLYGYLSDYVFGVTWLTTSVHESDALGILQSIGEEALVNVFVVLIFAIVGSKGGASRVLARIKTDPVLAVLLLIGGTLWLLDAVKDATASLMTVRETAPLIYKAFVWSFNFSVSLAGEAFVTKIVIFIQELIQPELQKFKQRKGKTAEKK